ncbi:MAG TPA: galactokinase [Armatimonadota bacterium]|jgi:galactokinase
MVDPKRLLARYQEVFGVGAPSLVRAPGRVNLIGEHTDYNGGFVLPIALEQAISMAITPRFDGRVELDSLDFPDNRLSFSLAEVAKVESDPWGNYVRGVASVLQEKGYLPREGATGFQGVVAGDVPVASGLSSSAALEVCTAVALQAVNGFELGGPEMALLCQRAENQFVGVNCGIMDQFISRNGLKDHALLLDCRTLGFKHVPLRSDEARVVVADTKKKRGLVDSEYNDRRRECEAAVAHFQKQRPEARDLRDVSLEEVLGAESELGDKVFRRARHVVSETLRTEQAAELLEAGDLEAFGVLMNHSHESLRLDYEVSCSELDTMVGEARALPGVLGARMTGAGFGGCAVALVTGDAEAFAAELAKRYESATGIAPAVYVCSAADGAGIVR